LLDSPSSLQS